MVIGMEPRLLELLAPARDLDCGRAAVNHGADSVYIGGPRFGAREAAGNSLSDIEKLVAYAHQFKAKVYVALNTLMTDADVEEAVRLAFQFYDIGVDALIIQDLGLLEAGLPPIALHASTQLDNRSPEKVEFLENIGFEQVVLARELRLAEIARIRAETRLRLEFFVHGALCVSYSGRCLISEVMAKRSANRGECAQYCRHSYQLFEEDGKQLSADRYLLSLKDLDLSDYLAELIAAGVDAFKIEGRLKDVSYVKNITAFYRQKLDRLIAEKPGLQAASSGECRFTFSPDPACTFHRGKTTYFVSGNGVELAEIRSPKSRGKRLGEVLEARNRSFTLSGDDQIANGDGLCYYDGNGAMVGLRVNTVSGRTVGIREGKVARVGTTVYRNRDTAFAKELTASEQCRQLPVTFALRENAAGLELRLTDGDGLSSVATLSAESNQATNPGSVSALAEKQLRKTGGTLFSVTEVLVSLNPSHHYPAALFNQLRREVFAQHLQRRSADYVRHAAPLVANSALWPAKAVDGRPHCTNRYAQKFFENHGLEIKIAVAGEPVAAAEPLMTMRYCLRAQLGICPRHNKNINKATPLILADKAHRYRLEFDCRCCEMRLKLSGPRD